MVPSGSTTGLAGGTGIVIQAGGWSLRAEGLLLKARSCGAAGWLGQGRPVLGSGARQRLWPRALPSECGIQPQP